MNLDGLRHLKETFLRFQKSNNDAAGTRRPLVGPNSWHNGVTDGLYEGAAQAYGTAASMLGEHIASLERDGQ